MAHIKGGPESEIFQNRKQYFSTNVQFVASAYLKFQDIVGRQPGSTHNSYIFGQSRLKQRIESAEFGSGFLLGDGGYRMKMTPYRSPEKAEEVQYNKHQIILRNTVERKYDLWKRRFPCFVFGLRCKLETSLTIIVACAVLYNFCISNRDPEPQTEPKIEPEIEAAFVKQKRLQPTSIAGQSCDKQPFVQQISQLN